MDKETLKLKLEELNVLASKIRAHSTKVDECQMELKGKIFELMKELEKEGEIDGKGV